MTETLPHSDQVPSASLYVDSSHKWSRARFTFLKRGSCLRSLQSIQLQLFTTCVNTAKFTHVQLIFSHSAAAGDTERHSAQSATHNTLYTSDRAVIHLVMETSSCLRIGSFQSFALLFGKGSAAAGPRSRLPGPRGFWPGKRPARRIARRRGSLRAGALTQSTQGPWPLLRRMLTDVQPFTRRRPAQ